MLVCHKQIANDCLVLHCQGEEYKKEGQLEKWMEQNTRSFTKLVNQLFNQFNQTAQMIYPQ
jgi:predicted metalloendopeptidase